MFSNFKIHRRIYSYCQAKMVRAEPTHNHQSEPQFRLFPASIFWWMRASVKVFVENTISQRAFSKQNHQSLKFKLSLCKAPQKITKKTTIANKLRPNLVVQTQIRQISGHRSTKILYLCVRIFMQIKVAKDLRVALTSVSHTTPKR